MNLDRLEEPKNPRKKEERLIHFGEQVYKEEPPSEEGYKKPALVVDRRKQSNVDRALIMRRLAERNLLLVNDNKKVIVNDNKRVIVNDNKEVIPPPIVPSEEIIVPKKRKLKIRDEPPMIVAPIVENLLEEKEENDIEKELQDIISVAQQKEAAPETVKAAPKRKIKLKIVPPPPEPATDITTLALREQQTIADRLPREKEKIIVKAPTYYMNNRKIYVQKITQLFQPYRKELLDTKSVISCDTMNMSNEFDLLNHQKIVRDYLNLYTPYRGLLLYFGLGAGKTCTSIAIAEGMKSNKRVFVLTPASLKMNFFSEMKKCGDDLYKKNQFWEFVSIEGRPEMVSVLSKALSLSNESIQKKKGAWLMNIKKPANFKELDTEEQNAIDEQINEMIRSKYVDINYNSSAMAKTFNALSENGRINPFDHSVILIDEAHDFVSRIVNKIKQPDSISFRIYDALMSATNAKVVLLTGTPIINYPNEIGILFNILRGYITTWIFTVQVKTSEKVTTETVLEWFEKEKFKTYDYLEYSGNKLTITRNPFGFINAKKRGVAKGIAPRKAKGGAKTKKNRQGMAKRITFKKLAIDPDEETPNDPYNGPDYGIHEGGADTTFDKYNGVMLDEAGNLSDADFQKTVVRILNKHGVEAQTNVEIQNYKALPDNADAFLNMFVNTETGEAQKMNLFQRRILGLTSYFRSAQEELMPRYVKTAQGDIFHVVKSPMSLHQFGIYEKIRKVEADKERNAKKRKRMNPGDGDLFSIASTYRVFSRAACNFVFPDEIDRPVPDGKEDEDVGEAEMDATPEPIDIDEDNPVLQEETSYVKRIQTALQEVNVLLEGTNRSQYLDKDVLENLSPKMLALLENLADEENRGLHLLYSHFRSIEGIGIMRLILLANGFAEFKIQKKGDWEIVEKEEDSGKPRFLLYTGTETAEEKEILRNIYNSNWDFIPASLSMKLKETYQNNFYGDVVKIIMITASGAQGINLKNTRFVHILEPYWHMVRVEQVVGRARRICSHQDLPEEMRTVKVFLYLSVLSELQKTDEKNIELRIRDISRIDKKTPVTSDESLYEIASLKQKINNQILRAVKETAIDCQLYASVKKPKKGLVTAKDDEEPLVCYGYGKVESNRFSSYPSLESDQQIKEDLDVRVKKWAAEKIVINDVPYAYRKETGELFDFESYQQSAQTGAEPMKIGRLVNERGQYRIVTE